MKEEVIRYRIREGSLLARLAARKLKAHSVAMVLGSTIHLHNVSKEDFRKAEPWLRHEQCHLKQFKEHGFFGFISKYVLETLRKGYRNNRFEVEAREWEKMDKA